MRWQVPAAARCTWLLLAALVAVARPASADFPKPTGYVNDFAQVLADDQKAYLENYLRLLEHDTSAEVVVATVDSLAGMSIEEYANRLFAEWGIGKKREDNGVLLLVAPRDRKVRIEVGYGLEPILPDGLAGEIIRTEILPEFRADNLPRGIGRGLNRINYIVRGLASGSAAPSAPAPESDEGPPLLVLVPLFGLLPLGVIAAVSAVRKTSRAHNGSTQRATTSWSDSGSSDSGSSSSGDSFGGGSSGGGGASGSW